MSQTTSRRSAEGDGREDLATTSAGPGRFVRPGSGPRPTSPLARVGAALALAALIIGVPALLLWLAGAPPIPTRLPTREDLTQNLGAQQLVTVLVAIVWIAWLQFTVCVGVELIAASRHRGVPSPVPLSGPSQRLARALVGALILSSVATGTVSAVVNAVSGPAQGVTVATAPQTPATASQSATQAGTTANADTGVRVRGVAVGPPEQAPVVAPATAPVTAGAGNQLLGSQRDLAPGTKFYTVKLPVGHHHDTLWEIAERHLGDGRRYKEIFELNKGHVQPDGRSLNLARLIYSGWELVMPADAVGVSVVPTPQAAPTPAPAPAPEPVALSTPSAHDLRADVAADTLAASDQAAARAADQSVLAPVLAPVAGSPASPLVAGLAGGGLLAACLLVAVQRTRRRNRGGLAADGDALEAEVGLRAGADLERARFVDAGLRLLAARCAAADVALPTVYAARADDDELSLLIAPPRTDAPDPWQVHDEGRRWTLRREHRGRERVDAPAAYPALVSLGRDADGVDVFVDLEATDGPVQVTGDPVVAAEVAAALAVQLATSPWSDRVRVSCVGLPPTVADVVPAASAGTMTVDADAAAVVARIEERAVGSRADVLSGRLRRTAEEAPEYAVLATPVSETLATRIGTLLTGGRHPVGVVAVGEVPGAQWQVQVDQAGQLTVPLLGVSVEANRLNDRSVDALAQLAGAASAAPPAAPTEGLRSVPTPAAATAADDGAYAIAPVRVGVLGPVVVRTAGPLDPSRTALAEEIVAFLALHPGGVHPTVLAAAIWPRGVSDAVATATVERVRDWLGTDPDGTARLRTDADGRHSLAPSVPCDWDAFCALVGQARSAAGPIAEADLLRRALRLVRGEAFENHPGGRYSWLARTGLERAIADSVVQVAHRLVDLGRSGSDPDGAGAAAAAGLRAAKTSQVLWRDVIEVEHERGGAAAAEAAEREMRRALQVDAAGEIPVEPETDALVEHLLGSRDTARHA